MKDRFAVAWFKGSNDAMGWNGCLVDKVSGKRHHLVNEALFEEFHGQQTWVRCSFDTKADLTVAAMRLARRMLK